MAILSAIRTGKDNKMSLRGRNEKYESIKPATNGSEDIGLTVKFRNSVTGRSREIMLIPPVQ